MEGRRFLDHALGQVFLGEGGAKNILRIPPGVLCNPGVDHAIVLKIGLGEFGVVVTRLVGGHPGRQVKVYLQAGRAMHELAVEPSGGKLDAGILGVLAVLVDQVADRRFQVQGAGPAGRNGMRAQLDGDPWFDVRRFRDVGEGHTVDGSLDGGQVVGAIGHAHVHRVDGIRTGVVGKGQVVDDLHCAIAVDV